MIKLFLFVMLSVMACASVMAQDAPASAHAKVAPPEPAWVATATKNIKMQYAQDIARATTNDLKTALAKKVLAAGVGETDTTGKFALLCYARDIGAGAGDFTTAFAAIASLDSGYQIDSLAMKSVAAGEITRRMQWTGQRRLFMQALVPMVDEAMAADRFDVAGALGESMSSCAQAVNDADALKYWAVRIEQIRQSNLAFKKLAGEAQTLARLPNDREANLAIGSFRCFVKGDWERGLPMLVIGGGDALGAAAAADIKGASGDDPAVVGAGQSAIGDAWFDAAQKAKGAERHSMQQRALRWYGRAAAMLSGAARIKIDKRMAQMESGPVPVPPRTHTTDIMAEMIGAPDPTEFENDVVVLKKDERLRTKDGVAAPVIFDIVAMTDTNNLCLGYAADLIGFAWEHDRTLLTIAGGVIGERKAPGCGAAPPNQWIDIELVVTPKALVINADGRLRCQMNGDFANVRDALKIFPCEGSVVRVKSVVMTKPE